MGKTDYRYLNQSCKPATKRRGFRLRWKPRSLFSGFQILLLTLLFVTSAIALNVKTLPSCLKIVTDKIEGSEVIALDIWVRAGGRNEDYRTAGISHFIEHLIFKGSKNYKTGEMERLIEEAGGIVNAATSKDFTHFYVVIPKQYFKKALAIMSDALTNPLFPKEELEKERLVVMEEILRHNSNHQAVLWDLIYAKSFRYHPYRYPVLGTVQTVSFLDRDTIIGHYQKYYRGKNITVIATGGLPDNAHRLLAAAFKDISRLKVKSVRNKESRITENILFEKEKKISKAYLNVAFSSPPAASFDSYVMDMIITILGNGRNSRLNKEIKENQSLVYDIDIIYPTPIDSNLVVIDASADPKNLDRATREIFFQLNLLKTKPVTDYEIKKAINKLEFDYKVNHAEAKSLASNLGYFATIADVGYEINYIQNIKRVSKNDIKRVAAKYFGYYTIGRFVPE
ncbi:M16 family metallopeptidase [Candidatus Margulisiibacteriota bacterium]